MSYPYRRYRARSPLYYRFRYRAGRLSTGQKAAAAGAAVVFLAGASQGAASAVHHADPVTVASAPGGGYTPASWASAFLAAIPEPQTSCDLAAVTAWEQAEGGAWNGGAADNPLDTAQSEQGSYAINSDGVQAFPDWSEGIEANVAAITNGMYGGILAALQAGNNAQAVADAVADSPWGTEPFEVSC